MTCNLLVMMILIYLGDLRASLLIETQNVSALSEPVLPSL